MFKRVGIDVAEQPFVQAVKIAGVDVAVALNDKLSRTVSVHAALFGILS